jgi:hypothetical protein
MRRRSPSPPSAFGVDPGLYGAVGVPQRPGDRPLFQPWMNLGGGGLLPHGAAGGLRAAPPDLLRHRGDHPGDWVAMAPFCFARRWPWSWVKLYLRRRNARA